MIPSDLKQLRTVIKQEVTTSEKRVLKVVGEKFAASENIIREEVRNTEKTLRGEIQTVEKTLRDEIVASEKRVLVEVGNFVTDHLIPVIDEKADKNDVNEIRSDIDKVYRKLDNYSTQTMENTAHELKRTKKKSY